MGTFAQLQFTDGVWAERVGVDERLPPDPTALRIEIYDSDIAALSWPSDDAAGLLYLGAQPRTYFDDEDASPPLDLPEEAAALAAWAESTTGTAPPPGDIEELAATDDPDHASGHLFVEDVVARLLSLLGVPLPDLLSPTDTPAEVDHSEHGEQRHHVAPAAARDVVEIDRASVFVSRHDERKPWWPSATSSELPSLGGRLELRLMERFDYAVLRTRVLELAEWLTTTEIGELTAFSYGTADNRFVRMRRGQSIQDLPTPAPELLDLDGSGIDMVGLHRFGDGVDVHLSTWGSRDCEGPDGLLLRERLHRVQLVIATSNGDSDAPPAVSAGTLDEILRMWPVDLWPLDTLAHGAIVGVGGGAIGSARLRHFYWGPRDHGFTGLHWRTLIPQSLEDLVDLDAIVEAGPEGTSVVDGPGGTWIVEMPIEPYSLPPEAWLDLHEPVLHLLGTDDGPDM